MVNISMTQDDYKTANYFTEGVHKVKIDGGLLDKMDDGREYIEIGVVGDDGEEDNVRFWLHTEASAKYTIRTLQGIAVHNAKEDDKEKVRQFFTGEFDDKKIRAVLDKLEGKEAWYSLQKSNRTYQNAQGETKHSYDRNLTGYEPKPRSMTVDELLEGSEKVEISDDIPTFN